MKVFSAEQIRELDAYTIEHEPVESVDLMERASNVFKEWFAENYPDENTPVFIFCGPGNNGGDGLAVARLLYHSFYKVRVIICGISNNLSRDCETNLERLKKIRSVPILELNKGDEFPVVTPGSIVIDAIFGSGINRPVEGYWAELIDYLNRTEAEKVSIDIPSGLFADRHYEGMIFRADRTLSFELPKLAFFFAENYKYIGEWEVRSIGLSLDFIKETNSPFWFVTQDVVRKLVKKRNRFDHKGTFGHALLVVGGHGKVGAAILASRACLRSGCGLVTVHVPKCAYEIMQIAFPEAMVSVDRHQFVFSESPDLKGFDAIGGGCGIGTNRLTENALKTVLESSDQPLVLDADALNILSMNKEWLQLLPPMSVLTPHPKEFERLFGKTGNDFERFELHKLKAAELNVYILLKGAYSALACPDGTVWFNSTGNPGMATGGTGDVLTGILTGLIAQGYEVKEAAILGAYLHGLAGDLAEEEVGCEALVAGDLVKYLGKAFSKVKLQD